jgi:hypothetical protein
MAARGCVPPSVLTKRKQGFFNEAVGSWLGAAGGQLVDQLLLAPEPAYLAVCDRAAVARIVREWHAGRTGHANLLLALVMLELWLGEYLPRATAAVPAGAIA